MGLENLNCFFNPRAIAVIGASERDDSLGAKILHNLIGSYQGLIFPVNPFKQAVQGIIAYPSVDKVPSKIDLAIIATPAHTIPQIIEECGKSGVRSVIIVSAGLNENDETGQDLIRQILEYKNAYGVRIIGPNSLGVIRPKTNLYATFGDKKAIPGKIAFISQSAALCGSVLDWSSETKVGLSAVVSTGSMIGVNLSELIEYFGADPQTRVIMLYVEAIKDIHSFMSAARGFARTKPIVIVKAGRFNKSRDFNLFGIKQLSEDDFYDAAFRRIGIVRVDTINELFDCAKALSMQPNPCSPFLTIITNASGPGLLAADQLHLKGGRLSQVSNASDHALRRILPYYCSTSNPIDILEEATPERFRSAMHVCLEDPTNGSVLVIYSPQGVTSPSSIAETAIDLASQTRKPFLVALMGEDSSCEEARRMLHRNGIPAFRTPEEAVSAFMNMYTYTRNMELLYQTPEEVPLVLGDLAHLKGALRRAFCEGRQILSLPESLCFLETYKIPTIETHTAKTTDEALILASELGFPVIMKALYAQSTFKNKKEELVCDVYSSSEVPLAFKRIVDKINSNSLAEFQGIVIQPKIQEDCTKLFLGLRKNNKFGSTIILGTRGDSPEIINDISVGFPPLNQVLARQIVEKTRIFQPDKDASSASTFEIGVIEEILVKFCQLVMDFPEIKQMDINPLIVNSAGALAVDGCITIDMNRIMRESADHHELLLISPYPRKYIAKRTLKNGVQVAFRPVKPEDEPCFNELFKSLSEDSVRFRFFEIIKEMSHDTLSRYCNLDYDREIAIVAELQNDRRMIGAVRLILDSERKNGEFAIMVSDSWHGLGLGSKLMDYIIDIAKDLKLETIYSYVTRANIKMTSLCCKKGFETKPVDEYTINMYMTLPR
ncbi:MAG: GNAT family N-acetyltransferase [Candidatus Bathyarchaeia archaeon]